MVIKPKKPVIIAYGPALKVNGNIYCPKCHAKLFREGDDLACIIGCGWRDSCFWGEVVEGDVNGDFEIAALMRNDINLIPD